MSPNGIVLVDKPRGPSSFEVVRLIRRNARISRVGHAGTLDPLAEGLLVVCLGEGCKLVPFLQDGTKRYQVRIALGVETDTLDGEGEIVRQETVPLLDHETVNQMLRSFVGRIRQVPPVYSALKKDGVKLYRKVRRGEEVALDPRDVIVDSVTLHTVSQDAMTLTVDCKKGTYIRSMARDIACALGTVGMVDHLRRIAASGFHVENALPFDALARGVEIQDHLISMSDALPHLPKILLNAESEALIRNGSAIPVPENQFIPAAQDDPHVALLSFEGDLIAIAKQQENALQPVRVMLKE